MFRGFLVRGRLCHLSVLSVVFVSRLYVQNLIIRFGQNENFFDIFSSEEPKKSRFEFFDPTFFRLSFELFNFNFNKLRDYLGFCRGDAMFQKTFPRAKGKLL
jgi:hypothetical protein